MPKLIKLLLAPSMTLAKLDLPPISSFAPIELFLLSIDAYWFLVDSPKGLAKDLLVFLEIALRRDLTDLPPRDLLDLLVNC